MVLAVAFREVFNHIRSQSVPWKIRFAAVYLGNPVVFFAFLFLLGIFFSLIPARLTPSDDSWFVMKEVSTNVNWLNPVTYIAITFPLYIFWLSLQNTFLHIDLETFLESYVSIGAVVAAVPGLYNLFVWCTQGMEGNVFGFLFFLPLLIASIFYLSMWIMALRGAYTSYEDDNGGQYSNINSVAMADLTIET